MVQLSESQYDKILNGCDSLEHGLLSSKLEFELVGKTIGDCKGLKVLDLGGGTGLYACVALSQGAVLVDVVDNSAAKLEKGQIIEATRSRSGDEGEIRWFEGDVIGTLHDLPLLSEGYDMVICKWLFNHAKNNTELESMRHSASKYFKAGGKLVNIRATGPFDVKAKYGMNISKLITMPDGVKFQVQFQVDPPFEFEATCLDEISSLSNEINRRHGFGNQSILNPQDIEIVHSDRSFWSDFLRQPYFAVTMAWKL